MFWATIFVVVAFLLALGLRVWFPQVCAICLATAVTWLYGLYAGWDPLIIVMLMGGSAVGLMYYLGGKWPEKFGFFKLPYLLTAFTLVYIVINRTVEKSALLAIVIVWLAFITVFLMRNKAGKNWFEKVVECCRNW